MKKIKLFFNEFKKFVARGNIIDLSVGVIIGSAFSAIVTSLTNKIIMPLINWLLSLGGENGLASAYSFLKKVYIEGTTEIDLTKSIYIDWGAFLTAIINFFIIAFVLFIIVKTIMNAKGFWTKNLKEYPNKKERKVLKKQGVNMKDYKAVIQATKDLREANKPAPVPPKPTTEQLLTEILAEIKKGNEVKVEKIEETIENQ